MRGMFLVLQLNLNTIYTSPPRNLNDVLLFMICGVRVLVQWHRAALACWYFDATESNRGSLMAVSASICLTISFSNCMDRLHK
jgi:hypothetical protein